jgi:hypothetical protein
MSTLSPEQVKFAVEETRWGVWRRFTYPDGKVFATYPRMPTCSACHCCTARGAAVPAPASTASPAA